MDINNILNDNNNLEIENSSYTILHDYEQEFNINLYSDSESEYPLLYNSTNSSENNTSETESSENNTSETELDSEDQNILNIINNTNCINYNLCKALKNKSTDYCNECLLYFHKKIKFYKNVNNLTCPICLQDDTNLNMLKVYACNHFICYECIFNIFWDKSYLTYKPKFPILLLKKKWEKFIVSINSINLRRCMIYRLESESDITNELYERYIKQINKKKIPKIFYSSLKQLIMYQINLNKFLKEYSYKKSIMKQSIEKCPCCRISMFDYVEI